MVEQVTLAMRHFSSFDLDEFRNARLSAIAQRYGVILSVAHERVSPVICPDEHLAALDLTAATAVLHLHRVTFNDRHEPFELRIAWCHLRDKHYMSITS
mgnify:FL=1